MHELLVDYCVFGLIKKVNVLVQPHLNFQGRNRSVYVILKQSIKKSMLSYGDAVPCQMVAGTEGGNGCEMWYSMDFS